MMTVQKQLEEVFRLKELAESQEGMTVEKEIVKSNINMEVQSNCCNEQNALQLD